MAEPIGALRVDLSANAAEFEKDMGKARKSVKDATGKMNSSFARFNASVGSAVKSLVSWRSALVAVAGATGLALLIKRSIEAADRIGKTADKIGAGVEALQELRYAAEIAGVGTNTLDMALQRFSRRFGEAVAGTGELKGILQEYDIATRNADGSTKSLDQALGEYADAIKGASTDQERLRLAFKGFDSEGAALVNMLRGGSSELNRMRQEARDLGLVLDEQMVRKAEEANDQLTRMSQILGVNLTRTLISLSPQIIALGDAFIKNIGPFVDWLSSKLPDSTANVQQLEARMAGVRGELERITGISFGTLLSEVSDLDVAFGENANKVRDLLKRMKELSEMREERARKEAMITAAVVGGLDKQAKAIATMREELIFEREQLGRTEEGQRLYNMAKKAGIEVTAEYVNAIQPLIAQIEAEKKAQKAAEEAQKERDKVLDDGKRVTESVRTETEMYGDELHRLQTLLDAGAISQDTYARAVEKARKDLESNSEAVKKNEELARDLGLTFTSAFEDAVVAGGKLSDVLRGIEQDLLRLAARRLVTEPLLDGFLKMVDFGEILTPSVGAGSSGGSGFMGASGVPGFAHGGDHRGGFRMVGENGPELEATGPSRIFSADKTADMLSPDGGDVTVNVYAPPGSNVETRESAGPGGRTIDVMIDEATARNISTPGSRTGRALRTSFAGIAPQLRGRG